MAAQDEAIAGLTTLGTQSANDLFVVVEYASGVTKKERRGGIISGVVSDTAYGVGWNGVTSVSPSKNAVYDMSLLLFPLDGSRDLTGSANFTTDGTGVTWALGSSILDASGELEISSNDIIRLTPSSQYVYFENALAYFYDTFGLEFEGGSSIKENSAELSVLANGVLNLGTATTTGINIGRTGITTTILGSLAGDDVVKTVKVSLSSAEILALNATPKQLIAAPGSGKTIQVARIIGKLNFVSAAYATNTTLQVHFNNGGSVTVISNQSVLLTSTVNRMLHFIDATPTGATSLQYIENADLRLNVASGNPTTGGGSLDLYITYKIITL